MQPRTRSGFVKNVCEFLWCPQNRRAKFAQLFFGTFDANAGAGPFSTHRQSHRGTTYSYPFLNQNLYVCIGVNQEDKPANGHVVARSQEHIQTWIRENIKDITVPPGRNLPVHGLWQFP